MSKQCCDIKNLDVLNEKVPENVIMPDRVHNAGESGTSAYDSHCKSCVDSSQSVYGTSGCNQTYNYRKYRLPRPMKHYRLSYTTNNGKTKMSGKPTLAAFERPGAVITNGSCNQSECYGCDSKVCAGQVVLNNDEMCDCMDYSASKKKGVHITRSANTRVNVRRGLSNRERLRQRGLTYAQNQNKYYDDENDNSIDAHNNGDGFNQNSEYCECSDHSNPRINSQTTVLPSNHRNLTETNNDKGFYTQGAVDSGTRMEKLKLDTFNKVNRKLYSDDGNNKNRNVIFRGDYKNNQNSKKFSINKRFYMGNRMKSCCKE